VLQGGLIALRQAGPAPVQKERPVDEQWIACAGDVWRTGPSNANCDKRKSTLEQSHSRTCI
jgi:hypothetical protein